MTKLGETHPNERCSITVDQVFIKSDRLVGHRCAKPSGSLAPVIAWLDACDVSTQGGGGWWLEEEEALGDDRQSLGMMIKSTDRFLSRLFGRQTAPTADTETDTVCLGNSSPGITKCVSCRIVSRRVVSCRVVSSSDTQLAKPRFTTTVHRSA